MIQAIIASLAFGSLDVSTVAVRTCPAVEVNQFEVSTCLIEVQNLSDKRVRVAKVVSLAANDVLTLPQSKEIEPHGIWQFRAEVHWENALGLRFHRFEVVLDGAERKFVDAHAYVNSVLDDPKLSVDLGVVNAGESGKSSEVLVKSREFPSLRLTKVLAVPTFAEATLSPDGLGATVVVDRHAPWGLQVGFAKFATNNATQPQVWVEVKADVHGEVVPAANPFDFGLMRTGERHEFLLRLDHQEHKPFRVGKLEVVGLKAAPKLENCAVGAHGCRVVRITVSDDQPLGALKGKLLVDLPDFKKTLPINLWGLLLSPDTKIKSLDPTATASSGEGSPDRSAARAPTDISQALKSATQVAEKSVDPPGHGPLLKWRVANEKAVYGYVVYRADEELGAFKRVNKDAIKADASNNSGSSYSWRDTSAVPGLAYWYRVGILFQDGSKQDLTGAQKIIAK